MQTNFAKKNMGKYIIALIAPNETGKTTVLNNIWDFLPCFYPKEKVFLNPRKYHEIIGYVESFENKEMDHHPIERKRKIGVNSLGDTVEQIKEGLAVLIFHDCDVIIIAVRAELKNGGDDWEYMLKEAIANIENTKLNKNHLDLINEGTSRGIKEEDLPKIADKIKGYNVIACSHYRDFFSEPKALKNTYDDPEPGIIRIPGKDGLNIDRLYARQIIDLVEQLP